ncbi:MAG TPA: GNAT family N-acetyltransferase [Longimicrobiales bacterium]|nr:GNAT family N-acetyltransferase [Longimicrobiales bacterium]
MSARVGGAYAIREGDAHGFFRAPFEAYGPDAPYTSPMKGDLRRLLDPRRNPFYGGPGEGTLFSVYRGSIPVGRVSAHVHHEANRRFGLSRGYFGFLDVAEDATAARLLLDAAETWARRRGCTEIAGNFSLTAVQEIGVVTRGHERAPYTAMHWSPSHLAGILEDAGYEPFFPMSTYELELDRFDPDSLLGPRQREILASDGFAWTRLGRRSFRRRMGDVRRLLNTSFAMNPHFVPVGRAEFEFQAGPLTWVVDPRLSVLVDHEGCPAGVTVCIPDLNPFLRGTRSRLSWRTPLQYLKHRRNARRAVVVFSGVAPPLQSRGLAGVMLHRVTSALKEAGYTHLGITWVSTENRPSLRYMEKLGARRLHDLSLFCKALDS